MLKTTIMKCWIGLMLAGITGLCLQAEAANMTINTPQQAVSRASNVFRAVGWSHTGKPSAKLVDTSHSESKRQPTTWEISADADGKLMAQIDGVTGRICHLRRSLPDRTEDIVGIDKPFANKQAERFLKVAGISLQDLRLESSKLVTHWTTPGAMQWEIVYRRVYKGFPFICDAVGIDLDPRDGSLLGLGGVDTWSPLPEATTVVLDRGQAVSKAKEYMAGLGIATNDLVSGELMIVQPNHYWEYMGMGTTPPEPTSSSLAWELHFSQPWTDTAIWIDARDGSVLGGYRSRDISRSKLNGIPLVGVNVITLRTSERSIRLSVGSTDCRRLLDSIRSLRAASTIDGQYPLTLTLLGAERVYALGYSAKEHRLVLLEKRYDGKTIKGNLAWRTDSAFEKLVAEYMKP